MPERSDKEFTDRLFGLRRRSPTGQHEFDTLCSDLGIEHRLAPPQHPQTNGMVERALLQNSDCHCISKGKAHKRYEFGIKVSVATTNRGGFVVGMRALPTAHCPAGDCLQSPRGGNPYDGHTLSEALEQVEILTDQRPEMAFVDRGYRGHGVENVKVFISGARRGVTRTIVKLLRRRSAIEPMIGHMKHDGRLTRSPLKGTAGDALFAVLCGCGHNIRMILRHLRAAFCQLIWLITRLNQITEVTIAPTEHFHSARMSA